MFCGQIQTRVEKYESFLFEVDPLLFFARSHLNVKGGEKMMKRMKDDDDNQAVSCQIGQ